MIGSLESEDVMRRLGKPSVVQAGLGGLCASPPRRSVWISSSRPEQRDCYFHFVLLQSVNIRGKRLASPERLGIASVLAGVAALLTMPGQTSLLALAFGALAIALSMRSRRAIGSGASMLAMAPGIAGFLTGGVALVVTGLAYVVTSIVPLL